jgi:hypothetical protein
MRKFKNTFFWRHERNQKSLFKHVRFGRSKSPVKGLSKQLVFMSSSHLPHQLNRAVVKYRLLILSFWVQFSGELRSFFRNLTAHSMRLLGKLTITFHTKNIRTVISGTSTKSRYGRPRKMEVYALIQENWRACKMSHKSEQRRLRYTPYETT